MPFTDIIVAVHGIGVQKRSETVRSVATRLAVSKTLVDRGHPHLISRQPLGYFGTDLPKCAAIRLIDDLEVLERMQLASIGFSEVFWSDIPKEVIADERTLEETKGWAHTVAARAEALCLRARGKFSVDDIVDLPSLVEKLTTTPNTQSQFVSARLDPKARAFLASHKTSKRTNLELRAVLVKNLNSIISGDVIFSGKHFQTFALRPETTDLWKTKPCGPELIRLNRLLLEDAFPAELSRTHSNSIIPPDFGLASEVLDEMIETIYVLESLAFLGEKAGIFKFDLADLLQKYLGDVQLVTEFGNRRIDVINRFNEAMSSIYEQNYQFSPDFKIHIVAHSEGTVVSLLGLLHAMSQQKLTPSDPSREIDAEIKDAKKFPEWLKHVHSYMTIGSPIDKHLLLWPRLWNALEPKKANELFQSNRIHWRNYYDYGDPVGFRLDTARLWLEQADCQAFEFCGCPKCNHDIGFARYLFPGEAHNEYWNDPEVFEHFVNDVVRPQEHRPKPPGDRWGAKWLSPLIPYMLSFLILAAGVFILYKALLNYTHPEFDPLQKYVRFKELGVATNTDNAKAHLHLLRTVLGITSLIAGATLLSRLPRLARGLYWMSWGLVAYALGCVFYWRWVHSAVRNEIGDSFRIFGPHWPTLGIFGLALIGGLCGFLVMGRKSTSVERRERWFQKGTRPLILCGAAFVGFIIISQMFDFDAGGEYASSVQNKVQPLTLSQDQIQVLREMRIRPQDASAVIKTNLGPDWENKLAGVKGALTVHPPEWPVMLASAAFLYLWWLSISVFDLSFIWHRYIRRSVANQRLLDWNLYSFAPRHHNKPEKCRATQIPEPKANS